ncbi:polymer-forming cytoskeletal protein [Anaerobacillus sp. CMMVII]|uniref:polymer-forming cytoskeletal protein n=1 Tax=Anaerobacillus sp. CMMVII TaxID=2755588 RepID=UPI0021B7A97F|nr:polymer-forming cytoskeletal protein [Anaerobacillus sp. CMMVII]MCT8138359.1 polymer-forming cytoskeletal protein [Anaerobacillus sp. CMMVII]
METEKIGDLIINGNGSTAGGTFQKVRLNGNGKVNGDIECLDFESNGSSKLEGKLIAKNTVINGSGKFLGDVTSEQIRVHGSSKIEGTLSFKYLEVKGASKVTGAVKGEKLFVAGTLSVGEDCEAEEANFQGGFTIDGLLNADKITVRLHGRSIVREIGGETIKVTKASSTILGLERFIKVLSRELVADVIEGDLVELEYTKAKVVRGNIIKLGLGCEIDLVEYKDELQINKQAVVKESIKID